MDASLERINIRLGKAGRVRQGRKPEAKVNRQEFARIIDGIL